MNGRSYVKNPLRSNAIVIMENNDKYCFLLSRLAYLHPCNNNHRKRVSNYGHFLNQLNFESFDITNGSKCSDVHKFGKLNNLSINIFELNFYQDQNKWRHKLVPIEVSENDSNKVVNLIIYKNQYAPKEKLNVLLGDHHNTFICRRCLHSSTSENMLMLHKPKCEKK